MKKIYISFMIAMFMGFGLVHAQNMVTNGDLESWTAGVPDNWSHVENITQESVIVYNGLYSAKHQSASSTSDFGHEKITGIVEGSSYNFSYYYLDNDPNAKTRVWSKWLDDAGATVGSTIESDYSTDNADWVQYSNNLIAPAGATQFYIEVRVYKEATEGGFVYYDDFEFSGDQTVYPEPSNYPTDFVATATGLKIDLTWTESTGDQLPSGYLLLGEKIRGMAFDIPVDGVPVETDLDWSDGKVAVNVGFDMGGFTFNGLEASETYSFTIFPYTNGGSSIDYKTDGTAPVSEATTANVVIISHEGFDADLGAWAQFSVTGEQVWEWADIYGVPPGCAKANGFSGTAVENEDWLISPQLDLSGYTNITFGFDHARNYASNDGLYVMVSVDYSGGDPTLATWTDITGSFAFPDPGSWDFMPAGTADITGYATEATFVAFVYNSTSTDASTWEVDNADVLGVVSIGINDNMVTNLQVYPNPASGVVSVVSEEDAQLNVVNLMGQTILIADVTIGVNQISVNDLRSGMYLMSISYADGTKAVNRLMVK